MAQFKPEYLSCVPQFDGNPNELNRFLSTCDSIITAFYDATNPNNFHNVYLLNSLIGKLTGSAKVVVNIQSVTTWNELKDTLYRNFADQRDEACLNRDLVLLKQFPNEKPQQFFDRCLQILNLICSYVDIHEEQVEAKILKRDLYNKLTLKTFLSGLTEPMGKTIRCMRPTDMNQALQFIIQEENIQYYQNFTSKNFIKQAPVQNRPGDQIIVEGFSSLSWSVYLPELLDCPVGISNALSNIVITSEDINKYGCEKLKTQKGFRTQWYPGIPSKGMC
ncbi:hypothetical protein NQ314_006728 [Rhamnusium bicolor]|uniref:Uncharacterized protein n=1 Tax=Rhamnusium bicolor TaxID=1586634 RepID=A0AAV8YZT6_9CUCU|nr:hypothetical protein NQ314_006728 [Rhamnusium bicolor]